MINNSLAFVGRGYGRGFDGYGMMGSSWGGPIMMIGMIIMTIILIVGVYLIVRYIMKSRAQESKSRTTSGNMDSALKILNERFAKGEISEEDYVRMKNNLMS